jgi:hypothetical protein
MADYTDEQLEKANTDTFIDYYEINSFSAAHNMILGTYYAFTTLSTVGFGDLAPRGNAERIICAIILMAGVAVFSSVLGNFIAIIEAYKAINEDINDAEKLDSFF